MKTKITIVILVLCFICGGSVIISSCRKSDTVRKRTTPLTFTVPAGFPPDRKLSHDHQLSANFDVTCASCHQQQAAYTTFDHDLGHGTNHQHTRRNVPVIFNMAWQREFEWDGRTKKLLDQPIACMTA